MFCWLVYCVPDIGAAVSTGGEGGGGDAGQTGGSRGRHGTTGAGQSHWGAPWGAGGSEGPAATETSQRPGLPLPSNFLPSLCVCDLVCIYPIFFCLSEQQSTAAALAAKDAVIGQLQRELQDLRAKLAVSNLLLPLSSLSHFSLSFSLSCQ